MPLKAYIGLPRSGKTYEVVVNVILPALRQGRRVVSNIAGLNYEAFCQILFKEGFALESIGQLVLIDHAQVDDPFFWRTDSDEQHGVKSFLQPGDLVAIDEIWRFWKKRGDLHPRVMNFCRMHGHFTHPVTGLTCEIALITQSIRDINENMRDIVAETYQMVKNTKLGSDKSYIAHLFSRGSTAKSNFIRTLSPRLYNPIYFSLYKSHSMHKEGDAKAKEKNPDSRGSILQGPLFRFGIPLAILFMLSSGFFLYRFLHPHNIQSGAVASSAAPAGAASAAVSAPVTPIVNDVWRVVGYYLHGDSLTVTLQNVSGAMRILQSPPNFKMSNMGFEVLLPEGGFATSWTVFNSKKSLLP